MTWNCQKGNARVRGNGGGCAVRPAAEAGEAPAVRGKLKFGLRAGGWLGYYRLKAVLRAAVL